MKTEPTFDSAWEVIIATAKRASKSYQHLLAASDTLAQRMCYRDDFVLQRVFPVNPGERRDCLRIIKWVEAEKKHVMEGLEKKNMDNERTSLIARLKLTSAELKLLGITIET